MSEQRNRLPGELAALLEQHLQAVSSPEGEMDPAYVQQHLEDALHLAGLPPEAVEEILELFEYYTQQVTETRERYAGVQRQIDDLRASGARRIGRVTRITDELQEGRPAAGIWIDDQDFMILPASAEMPRVGEIVQFARGADGDAAYFGSHGFDHSGLVSAKLKSVQKADAGRSYVEVSLREMGDVSDVVVAVASDQLAETLDDLQPGAMVRVTDGRSRIAFPAPQPDEDEKARTNPLFTFVDPIPAKEDPFVYSPSVIQSIDEMIQVIREPERAQENGVEIARRFLLEGPSGTGKTTIVERKMAREVAELGFQTIKINTANLTSEWYGRSEKLMQAALEAGGDRKTFIILNEIDAVAPKRGAHDLSSSSDVSSRVFGAIGDALDRCVKPGEPPRILAFTTNYPSRLDAAFRSRLDLVIPVGLPDRETSVKIAASYLKKMKLEEDPTLIAERAISALDVELVRVVFDGSSNVRTYQACDTLSGRTIKLAIQAAGRAAFFARTTVTAFSLACELRRKLYANLVDLGREDLSVALGLSVEDARRVSAVHVKQEVLRADQPTMRDMRMRFRCVA